MKIWALLRPHLRRDLRLFVVAAGLYGVTAAWLNVISSRAGVAQVMPDVPPIGLPTLLAASTIVAVVNLWIWSRVGLLFAAAIAAGRGRLIAAFAHLEPVVLDTVQRAEIREVLAALPARLNNVVQIAAEVLSSSCDAFVTVTLLLVINRPAGLSLIAVYAVCLGYQWMAAAAVAQHQLVAREFDHQVSAGLADLLGGFKELLLNQGKSAALLDHAITRTIRRRREARRPYRLRLAESTAFMQAIEPLVILPCVVAMAIWSPAGGNDDVALLMLFIAPFSWLQLVPQLAAVEANAAQILALGDSLQAAARQSVAPPPTVLAERFRSLRLCEITYRYRERPGTRNFGIGPLSCRFDAGTVTFVTGGNGSGKSTLIRLITGLYPASAGVAELNDRPVDMRSYRDLFSTVLADQVLFDRIYGVDDVDAREVNDLLHRLGLGQVTRYEDGKFTKVDLSTGQRKRVALVAALMERKPILVLDEWAADQDPETRRDFYRSMLPELRNEGRTIIAVTHDDAYFDACDQLLAMANGRLKEGQPARDHSPAPASVTVTE